jgi:predicted metalloprotease
VWNSPRRGRRRNAPRRSRAPLGSSFVFLDRADAARRRARLDELGQRLRRVRTDLAACRRQEFLPGKSTRVRAGRLAYVDLLLEACDLLQVEHELDRLTGIDQQLEVLRVEAALGSAGMQLQTAG